MIKSENLTCQESRTGHHHNMFIMSFEKNTLLDNYNMDVNIIFSAYSGKEYAENKMKQIC